MSHSVQILSRVEQHLFLTSIVPDQFVPIVFPSEDHDVCATAFLAVQYGQCSKVVCGMLCNMHSAILPTSVIQTVRASVMRLHQSHDNLDHPQPHCNATRCKASMQQMNAEYNL